MNLDCLTAWPASLACVTPFGSATWRGQHRFQRMFRSLAAWQAYGSSVPSRTTRYGRRQIHCRAQLEWSVLLLEADAVYCRSAASLKEGGLAVSNMMGMLERPTTTLPKEMCILFLSFPELFRRSFSTSGARSNRITCTGGPAVLQEASAMFDPENPTRVRPLSGMVSMPISTDFDKDSTMKVRTDDDQQYVGDEGLWTEQKVALDGPAVIVHVTKMAGESQMQQ